jgi:hypothetical protein
MSEQIPAGPNFRDWAEPLGLLALTAVIETPVIIAPIPPSIKILSVAALVTAAGAGLLAGRNIWGIKSRQRPPNVRPDD